MYGQRFHPQHTRGTRKSSSDRAEDQFSLENLVLEEHRDDRCDKCTCLYTFDTYILHSSKKIAYWILGIINQAIITSLALRGPNSAQLLIKKKKKVYSPSLILVKTAI